MEATSNKETLAVTNVSTALSWPVASASVTFEPAARRAWYTHLLGQTGWAQRDGGPVEEIRPGDVVWFPPGEKTLAWGVTLNGYDAYCNSRGSGWQGGELDGEGQRRAIQAVNAITGFARTCSATPQVRKFFAPSRR